MCQLDWAAGARRAVQHWLWGFDGWGDIWLRGLSKPALSNVHVPHPAVEDKKAECLRSDAPVFLPRCWSFSIWFPWFSGLCLKLELGNPPPWVFSLTKANLGILSLHTRRFLIINLIIHRMYIICYIIYNMYYIAHICYILHNIILCVTCKIYTLYIYKVYIHIIYVYKIYLLFS